MSTAPSKQSSKKLVNGIIAFLADGRLPGPVFLDFAITNTFPILSLRKARWRQADGSMREISEYDHLSVPPDLRLHLSGPDHVFFDAKTLWAVADGSSDEPFAHCFTVVSPPHRFSRPLVEPGVKKTWYEAALFSPLPDNLFTGRTRLGVDLFVHRLPMDSDLLSFPFPFPGTRLARDADGPVAGPYLFDSLQRRTARRDDLALSFRMTYIEMTEDPYLYLHIPLPVFAQREKKT